MKPNTILLFGAGQFGFKFTVANWPLLLFWAVNFTTSSQLACILHFKMITKMINNGIESNKIAVIVPNEQIALTLEMFDDEHYFNFAMGRSISKSKIILF